MYFVLDWDSWNVVVYEVQENESFSKLVKFPHFGIENEFPSANLQEKLIEPKEKYLLKKPSVFDLQVCRWLENTYNFTIEWNPKNKDSLISGYFSSLSIPIVRKLFWLVLRLILLMKISSHTYLICINETHEDISNEIIKKV